MGLSFHPGQGGTGQPHVILRVGHQAHPSLHGPPSQLWKVPELSALGSTSQSTTLNCGFRHRSLFLYMRIPFCSLFPDIHVTGHPWLLWVPLPAPQQPATVMWLGYASRHQAAGASQDGWGFQVLSGHPGTHVLLVQGCLGSSSRDAGGGAAWTRG